MKVPPGSLRAAANSLARGVRSARARLRWFLLGRAVTARGWRVEAEDVFVVSYPRSGNGWVRRLLVLLQHPELDLTVDTLQSWAPDPYVDSTSLLAARRPRLIKSHERHDPSYPKIIYVLRDGRDCLASWYDRARKLQGFAESFEAFVRLHARGDHGYGAWHDHVASWLLTSHSTPMLTVRYETLWSEPARALQGMATFLGIRPAPAAIEAAVSRCSLAAAARLVELRQPDAWRRGFRGGLGKGPGGWRSAFSAELAQEYWAVAGEVSSAVGYSRDEP